MNKSMQCFRGRNSDRNRRRLDSQDGHRVLLNAPALMRLGIVCVAACVLSLLAMPSAVLANELYNPGFEADADNNGFPDDWVPFWSPDPYSSWVSYPAPPHTGNAAVEVGTMGDPGGGWGWAGVFQDALAQTVPGARYALQAYIADAMPFGTASAIDPELKIEFYDAGGDPVFVDIFHPTVTHDGAYNEYCAAWICNGRRRG